MLVPTSGVLQFGKERQTDRPSAGKPYHMCYSGNHWGALRGWNVLDLRGVSRLLLEELWASSLTSLNLCFLICKIGYLLPNRAFVRN